jgi:hypothetical protein
MILCGTANAALDCSVPAEVGLGDVIHGQIVLHLRSNKGFSWNVQEQGSGRAVTWDPGETQNCSEPCTEVFPWRYTADANLETFYAWQSPSTSDTYDLQITSIEPYQRGTPIPKYVKDAATNLAGNYDYWNRKIAWAGLACLYPGFAETAFGGGYCVIGAGLTIVLGEQSHNLTEMAKDPPWPDQCYTPQDPEWVDAATLGIPYAYSNIFGDGGVEYYYNLSVANAIRLHAWRTMAVKEANAASGCLELQDLSNADWHIDRARWAVSAYADEAGGLANNLWAIGWYFANYWRAKIKKSGKRK